ncbi:hypothetical protein JOC77_001608 [Peribacillus deserti]|uniref:YtkA-like domain-containing protein n=1 Tax=Peribacillus deserti TaxID=673318 RepID=A0ABS2QG92_9BACI|nr:hypothetical protein [Peribacillus deserti]MBM7692181.1 hypothetical protein [Peribacillus deserti]
MEYRGLIGSSFLHGMLWFTGCEKTETIQDDPVPKSAPVIETTETTDEVSSGRIDLHLSRIVHDEVNHQHEFTFTVKNETGKTQKITFSEGLSHEIILSSDGKK